MQDIGFLTTLYHTRVCVLICCESFVECTPLGSVYVPNAQGMCFVSSDITSLRVNITVGSTKTAGLLLQISSWPKQVKSRQPRTSQILSIFSPDLNSLDPALALSCVC